MPDLTRSYPETAESLLETSQLPLGAIVRALCQAANAGPDVLYEVMLKLSLMVEATAPMFGLSTWTLERGQRPRLEWTEGLSEPELTAGKTVVEEALATESHWPEV